MLSRTANRIFCLSNQKLSKFDGGALELENSGEGGDGDGDTDKGKGKLFYY